MSKRTHEHKHDAAKLYEMYQTMTLEEVGEQIGISRERVRQILKRDGYLTQAHWHKKSITFDPNELYGMYQTMTLNEVGEKVGFSSSTVRKILNNAGYSTRLHFEPKTKTDQETEQKIIEYRKAGMSYREISIRVGKSAITCHRIAKEAGIPKPSRKESKVGRPKSEFPKVCTATRLTIAQRQAAEQEAARQGMNLAQLLERWVSEKLAETKNGK